MKAVKVLTALIILQFSPASSYAAGLNSVYSYDGISVWAAGLNGYVIHSTDGGNTWTSTLLGTTVYNSVSANGQYVWIAGNNGILQLSTNNGNSWNQYFLAGGVDLKSVFFINSTTGWIAGTGGTILKSTNSGINWTAETSNTSSYLNCISFTDNLNGAACGANGTVIVTSDGGNNWMLSATSVTKEMLSIDMKGSSIIASGLDATVLKSTSSGASWNIINYKITTKVDVNSVFMFDANTYFSCGSDGFIRKSTDAGTTFNYLPNPMLADLHRIFFFNSSTGWAAGLDNNVVIKTTDGGASWQMPAGTTQSLSWVLKFTTIDPMGTWGSIFSLNPQNPKEIFLCANNRISRSLNSGSTFQSISVITGGNAPHGFVISPKDSNKMLVAYDSLVLLPPYGDYGKIMKTTNYGVNWFTVFSQTKGNVDSNPFAVDPDHPDTVYLGTPDSLIYRSTDFGSTWTPTGPSILGTVCTIHVVRGHSNVLIAGAAPDTTVVHTYRSTDYGNTWSIVLTSNKLGATDFPEVPTTTSNINFPDKIFQAYFYGTNSGVHISNDDGLTWTRALVDTLAWGLGIVSDDPNIIFMGEDETNKMFLSMNGGNSWNAINNAIYPMCQSFLCYNRKVILAQQHYQIIQLTASYNNPIGIQPISNEVPVSFSLEQNFPNPFNPSTTFIFHIPKESETKLTIYDELGRMTSNLVNQKLIAGIYEVSWDASNFPSGVYFCRLEAGSFSESKKIILLK